MYYALIMAGGSGTRLWPLSRERRPKQSLELVGQRSMFQHSVDRLIPLFSLDDVWVVTREEHADLLRQQVSELPAEHFIMEPEGRGTAPAIGLAAIHLYHQNPEAVMAVLTADHYISNAERFQQTLSAAEEAAQKGHLVTLGITPTSPSTAFGYIEEDQKLEQINGFDVFRVRQFTEKPNRETAARMVSSGLYTWNSGMFVWQVKRILEEFERQMPEFYARLMAVDAAIGTKAYSQVLEEIWPEIPKQTIDYGIMEGAADVVVIPVEMGWSDIGSWSSLSGVLPTDADGNIIDADHEGLDTHNTIIFGHSRLISTIGVKDLVIVDTDDALLICAKDHEQQVKDLVEKLKRSGRQELL